MMREDILQLLEDWAHGLLAPHEVHNRAIEMFNLATITLPPEVAPPEEQVISAILHGCWQRQAEQEMADRRASETSSASTNKTTYKVLVFDGPATT